MKRDNFLLTNSLGRIFVKSYYKVSPPLADYKCNVGTCQRLFCGGRHGDNEAEVYKELCEIAEENIPLYNEDNEPLPSEIAGKEKRITPCLLRHGVIIQTAFPRLGNHILFLAIFAKKKIATNGAALIIFTILRILVNLLN